jgi:hypothetical protein
MTAPPKTPVRTRCDTKFVFRAPARRKPYARRRKTLSRYANHRQK